MDAEEGRKEEGKRGQGRGRSPERAKGVRREGRREGGREGVFRARMYIYNQPAGSRAAESKRHALASVLCQ